MVAAVIVIAALAGACLAVMVAIIRVLRADPPAAKREPTPVDDSVAELARRIRAAQPPLRR